MERPTQLNFGYDESPMAKKVNLEPKLNDRSFDISFDQKLFESSGGSPFFRVEKTKKNKIHRNFQPALAGGRHTENEEIVGFWLFFKIESTNRAKSDSFFCF